MLCVKPCKNIHKVAVQPAVVNGCSMYTYMVMSMKPHKNLNMKTLSVDIHKHCMTGLCAGEFVLVLQRHLHKFQSLLLVCIQNHGPVSGLHHNPLQGFTLVSM